ncbi:helix-turn-helix domain-containing protein [Priestia taiwanensis]|uniref:HTH cro/C1-type domain-containing protein n=1 Tax=Priestia taiwanensis TaxID=1347902 RepID=A0A917ETU1_9BACI|nr:helix-turn-helix transcriptional regulator [Priestia taiwanensis]MBM7364585.1 DNA-binding XRE family transcriptional regulator [Priestia taiwanensis]GGE80346.1 hypothetical protein GCM10007140_32340 [Priestia taiwanensis]
MENELFRAVRLYKEMTQHEFAKYLEVSHGTIGRIEQGSLKVTPNVKAKLISKFELTDAFFDFFENYKRLSQLCLN